MATVTPALKTIAVIIAGGSGTRFWPSSRRALPKQFLKLSGDRSLITDTAFRVEGLADEVMVACGATHVPLAEQHLGVQKRGLIVEPRARNTAPAIALAVRHVLSVMGGDAVMFVLPADHFVRDIKGFQSALRAATAACEDGSIVTLGITPDRPETGYGYIARGNSVGDNVYAVSRFVEKPVLADAEKFLAAGTYAWNAGIFVFKASAMWDALVKFAPEVAGPLVEWKPGQDDVLKAAFDKMPSISIDYAVMEKAPNVKVIPTSCGWSDVGSWDALPEVREADAAGNVVSGDALLIGSKNNVVFNSSKKKVCVLGIEDLIIVETEDTLLVMPKGAGQRVREVVDALEKTGSSLI